MTPALMKKVRGAFPGAEPEDIAKLAHLLAVDRVSPRDDGMLVVETALAERLATAGRILARVGHSTKGRICALDEAVAKRLQGLGARDLSALEAAGGPPRSTDFGPLFAGGAA
jgi:hypothetical protein